MILEVHISQTIGLISGVMLLATNHLSQAEDSMVQNLYEVTNGFEKLGRVSRNRLGFDTQSRSKTATIKQYYSCFI